MEKEPKKVAPGSFPVYAFQRNFDDAAFLIAQCLYFCPSDSLRNRLDSCFKELQSIVNDFCSEFVDKK